MELEAVGGTPRAASASSARRTSSAPSTATRRLSRSSRRPVERACAPPRASAASAKNSSSVSLAHARLQLRARCPRATIAAVVDDRDPVGEAVGLLEVLRREQDRRALVGERLSRPPRRRARLRGSRPVVGSSRKSTCGRDDQAHREVEPAPHAAAVGGDAAVGGLGEVEALEQLGRRASRRARRRSRAIIRRFSAPVSTPSTAASWAVRLIAARTALRLLDARRGRRRARCRRRARAAWRGCGRSSSCRRRSGRAARTPRRPRSARSSPSSTRVVAERLREALCLDCVCHTHKCTSYTCRMARGLDRRAGRAPPRSSSPTRTGSAR